MHTEKRTEISRQHKDKLGMEVPEDYFSKSKVSIMEKVSASGTKQTQLFHMKPAFRYAIAAAVVLLVGLGISLTFLSDNNSEVTIPETEHLQLAGMADEDYLLTSLLVSDDNVEVFLDHYLLEGILEKAELKEQEFDDVFMNSLIVKDSFIDTYIDSYFINDIIL